MKLCPHVTIFIDCYRKGLFKQLNIDCLKNISYQIISQMGVPAMCSSTKQFIFCIHAHTP